MQHERRCSRACGEDVSFRDVKIKIPDRNVTREMWMTPCTGSVRGGFWGFEKSQWVEFLPPRKTVDFRSLLRPCGGCRTWFGADGKVSIERLCLSPHVKKPFNSKVIKCFVPELRSPKVFRVSGFLCSMYICYEHSMYVSIFMYGYVTKLNKTKL